MACREISFAVERGEVFGLLGPNGAGKTTTLRMLAGLYAPDEGSATVAGFEIAAGRAGGPELRARVGLRYLAQTQVHCRQAAVVPPSDTASVFYACMINVGRELVGWLGGITP